MQAETDAHKILPEYEELSRACGRALEYIAQRDCEVSVINYQNCTVLLEDSEELLKQVEKNLN